MSPSKEGAGPSSSKRYPTTDRVYVEIPPLSMEKRLEYMMFNYMSPAKPLKPSHSYSRYVGSPSRRIVITGSEAESISSRSNSDFYDASPPPRARSYLTPTSCGTREYSTSPEPPSVSCASGSGRSSPTPIPNHTKPRKGRRSPETSGSTVLVPWVEITNLEEVLADPEWRLIRRRYLEWKANKLVSRRHSKGKGKEKATVHILSDEEDEEEEAVELSLEFANEPAYGSSFRRGVTPRRRPRKFDNYSLRPSPASERYTISSDDEEDVYQPSTDGRAPLGLTEVETGEESVLSPQYGHPSRSHSPPTKPAAKKRGRPKGFKSTAKPKNLQLKRTKFVVPSDDNSDQSTSDTIEHLAADEDVCSTFRPPQKTKGTRAVSMFSYRLPQRPHVVLKPAVIDSLPVRHCHMCHKKHVFMACDRCSSAWCDHCLSKFPIPFDPHSNLRRCPKCKAYCICSACVRQVEPECMLEAGLQQVEILERFRSRLPLSKLFRKLRAFAQRPVSPNDVHVRQPTQPQVLPPEQTPPIATALKEVPQYEDVVVIDSSSLSSSASTPMYPPEELETTRPRPGSPGLTLQQLRELDQDILSTLTSSPRTPRIFQNSDERPTSAASLRSSDSASYFQLAAQKLAQEPLISLEAQCLEARERNASFRQGARDARWRYGFLRLDEKVIIPGHTWAKNVGMFGFDDDYDRVKGTDKSEQDALAVLMPSDPAEDIGNPQKFVYMADVERTPPTRTTSIADPTEDSDGDRFSPYLDRESSPEDFFSADDEHLDRLDSESPQLTVTMSTSTSTTLSLRDDDAQAYSPNQLDLDTDTIKRALANLVSAVPGASALFLPPTTTV